jgi:acyl-CoA reductase-like NAD-dependent aldehyde dehydrogenase
MTDWTQTLDSFYDRNPEVHMGRMVNDKHWAYVTSMLSATQGKVVHGGRTNRSTRFIEPTLILNPSLSEPLMQNEIYGPILPILSYKTLQDALDIICNVDATPLGLYIMSDDTQEIEFIKSNSTSGDLAINDCIAQMIPVGLKYGGIGTSGFGAHRGRAGIDTFSHVRSVVTVSTSADFERMLEWRYPAPKADDTTTIEMLKNVFTTKLP